MPTVNPELHKAICNILFKEKNSIILNSKSSKTLNNVNTYLETYLEDNFLCKYTDNFYEELSNGIIFGIILAIFPATILLWKNNFLPVIIFSILFVIMCFIFFLLFKIYTPEGKKIISQINGFKMFLETTEIERINIIGTPPEKTPELYEKYLPYAIALGIEAEWTKQFAPLFNQMQQNEIYYRPIWITHPNNYKFHSLSSGLTSNLSNAISSAINPPGSHSGFGGGSSYGRGGSSGGGGGGGGGGGW